LPDFSASVLEYTVSAPYSASTLTVTATPAHSKATVSYNPPIPATLEIGTNIITITVTAESASTSKIYTLTVTREGAPDIVVEGKLNYYDSIPITLTTSSTINFSEVYYASPRTMTFTVHNTGVSDLHPVLTISNAVDPNAYTLPVPTIPPVIPGGSYNFDVVYTYPTTVFDYTQTGTLTISSEDPDTGEFILNLTGTWC
jgi:hypothetical protein